VLDDVAAIKNELASLVIISKKRADKRLRAAAAAKNKALNLRHICLVPATVFLRPQKQVL
jgi:hypothetical protein